ncbi:MAG: NAD(P)/FAD-dependent oxidoreductase [Promethearchaeota archaeon]|nr:MAG: NAD(P)/FAD-dependent oxidoreductase [Candidatus Lokiarchaeota archaeon]
MKVIIIGSGIAGLTAGAYLACEGHKVIIYEQFPEIGGVTATIHEKGYSWDLGPLLLGGIAPHESLGKILAELAITDKIKLIYEDRGQSFPDFQIWRQKEYEGPYWRREYLRKIFPEESEGLDKYYEFYDRMVELGYLLNELPFISGIKALITKLKLLFKFLKVKKLAKWSAAEVLDYFFNSPKLKAVFTGILADIVTKPSEFPGLGVPFFNIETAFDKRIPTKTKWGMLPVYHYIKNGCGELVKAFADLILDHEGEIHPNCKVQKILIENNQVKGVQLENEEKINADIVLASGGMFNTFFNLVGKEYLPAELITHIETKKLMESVFMVHLGIDFDPSKFQRAALCYYYLTYDIEKAIGEMREGIYHEGKDGFLIYIPSMHSPEMAPPGKHAVTIYTVGPHELKEGSWQERREEMADKLIMEAEKIIPGLYEGSEVKIIMTPDDFKKRIDVVRHSFGGTAPVMGEVNPSHRTPIQNLWYIGAYSESGGGVAGASLGGRNVAKMILKEK